MALYALAVAHYNKPSISLTCGALFAALANDVTFNAAAKFVHCCCHIHSVCLHAAFLNAALPHWLQLCHANSKGGNLQCMRRYLDLLESVSPESAVTAKAQIVYEKKQLEDMVLPKMVSSCELDDLVQPQSRSVILRLQCTVCGIYT